MEAIFIYLVKSSGLLALFFISYHILLRKETFFTSNRWFLLSGLATAVFLPLLVFTKVVWVEPIAIPIDLTTIPLTTVIEQKTLMDYCPLILASIYGMGILVLAVKFLHDFYSLKQLLKGKSMQRQADYKLVDTKENLAPFSYFNTIVYNSALYTATELENILEHEKVHSDQNHTVDVLISRFFCILFWFHPFVWLYKKAVLQNLEFIADSEATKKITDKKAYQITLLKITTQENCVAITNHFYQSLIKKRIVMLNKNQSKKRNSLKYLLVIPALVAFVLSFQIEVVAQEKKNIATNVSTQVIDRTIDKDATDLDLENLATLLKKSQDVDLVFSNIKRNAKSEITAIKLTFNDKKGTKGINEQKSNKPISPIRFVSKKYDDGKIEIGFYDVDKTDENKQSEVTDATDIYIDGEKVTQETLDSINPDTIKKMNVIKSNGKSTITIVTKKSEANTINEQNSVTTETTSNDGIQKTTSTVKIVKKVKNGIPEDTEIYIDGIKSTQKDLEALDPSLIDRMDISKATSSESKKTVKVITKKS